VAERPNGGIQVKLRCLAAWIGRQDLKGIAAKSPTGPVIDFLRVHSQVEAFLLSDWAEKEGLAYISRLRELVSARVELRQARLSDPTDFLAVYREADQLL
jgi:hypothetical protein